ncbi:MAG: hypothetical protein KJ604_20345 [Gammaproteobacteria bacterium]|nr:hypothetical protein [Gammaproteobacteria bacterium]
MLRLMFILYILNLTVLVLALVGLLERVEGGKITVEGYLYKGKLIFSSPGALGHEMIHLLNEKYSNLVWNPDKIGED